MISLTVPARNGTAEEREPVRGAWRPPLSWLCPVPRCAQQEQLSKRVEGSPRSLRAGQPSTGHCPVADLRSGTQDRAPATSAGRSPVRDDRSNTPVDPVALSPYQLRGDPSRMRRVKWTPIRTPPRTCYLGALTRISPTSRQVNAKTAHHSWNPDKPALKSPRCRTHVWTWPGRYVVDGSSSISSTSRSIALIVP
jgi:hypothetical protein